MNALKIKPKILVLVFISVGLIADLIPAPNLGPGLVVTSLDWLRAQFPADSTVTVQSDPAKIKAQEWPDQQHQLQGS